MTMGHGALSDVHRASLGYISVISVTMVAVDHGRLSTLLGEILQSIHLTMLEHS